MSSIRTTVHSTLESNGLGSYVSHDVVGRVVEELEAREDNALSVLREFADDNGLPSQRVDALFEAAGLVEPAPEPEPGSDSLSLQALVAKLSEQVEALTSAAQRHGVRV